MATPGSSVGSPFKFSPPGSASSDSKLSESSRSTSSRLFAPPESLSTPVPSLKPTLTPLLKKALGSSASTANALAKAAMVFLDEPGAGMSDEPPLRFLAYSLAELNNQRLTPADCRCPTARVGGKCPFYAFKQLLNAGVLVAVSEVVHSASKSISMEIVRYSLFSVFYFKKNIEAILSCRSTKERNIRAAWECLEEMTLGNLMRAVIFPKKATKKISSYFLDILLDLMIGRNLKESDRVGQMILTQPIEEVSLYPVIVECLGYCECDQMKYKGYLQSLCTLLIGNPSNAAIMVKDQSWTQCIVLLFDEVVQFEDAVNKERAASLSTDKGPSLEINIDMKADIDDKEALDTESEKESFLLKVNLVSAIISEVVASSSDLEELELYMRNALLLVQALTTSALRRASVGSESDVAESTHLKRLVLYSFYFKFPKTLKMAKCGLANLIKNLNVVLGLTLDSILNFKSEGGFLTAHPIYSVKDQTLTIPDLILTTKIQSLLKMITTEMEVEFKGGRVVTSDEKKVQEEAQSSLALYTGIFGHLHRFFKLNLRSKISVKVSAENLSKKSESIFTVLSAPTSPTSASPPSAKSSELDIAGVDDVEEDGEELLEESRPAKIYLDDADVSKQIHLISEQLSAFILKWKGINPKLDFFGKKKKALTIMQISLLNFSNRLAVSKTFLKRTGLSKVSSPRLVVERSASADRGSSSSEELMGGTAPAGKLEEMVLSPSARKRMLAKDRSRQKTSEFAAHVVRDVYMKEDVTIDTVRIRRRSSV